MISNGKAIVFFMRTFIEFQLAKTRQQDWRARLSSLCATLRLLLSSSEKQVVSVNVAASQPRLKSQMGCRISKFITSNGWHQEAPTKLPMQWHCAPIATESCTTGQTQRNWPKGCIHVLNGSCGNEARVTPSSVDDSRGFRTVGIRPRLCKNVFERDKYSKSDWKSRFYAKSTSADVPINFRFNVDAHTSILVKRFYTLWARSSQSATSRNPRMIQIASLVDFYKLFLFVAGGPGRHHQTEP